MPLHRRVPKRGFTNIFRKEWATVSVEKLERLFAAGATVDATALKAAGAIDKLGAGVKVLGNGELKKALVVSARKFTEGARRKIEAAGGRCEVLSK
jgi:large subunit ribosomal protein L15